VQGQARRSRREEAEDEVPQSRREAGKAERKRRIVQAARELIRETGNAGLSMRALAERAGVSQATPYNLFGSKRAIVLAVVDDARDYQERFAHLAAADPIERLFAAADLAMEYYLADPAFYRTLWAAVFDPSGDIRAEIYNPKQSAFWRGLLDRAVAAGAFADDIDTTLMLRAMNRASASALLEWVVGELPSALLAPSIRHGWALIFAGAAAPAWRERLAAHVRSAQEIIAKNSA
jgi:AcrR family transcriptional regulator